MKQMISLLLSVYLLDVAQGLNLYAIQLNCSKYRNEPGEVFHPHRSINGSNQVDYCVECRCDKTHSVATCFELECPKLRCQKGIQKEGECCRSCDASDAKNLEYVSKCTHGGSTYTDLTVIPSLNNSNPCEVCYCWEGEIVCDNILKTCPKLGCRRRKLIWDAKKCCPRCPPSTTSTPAGQNKNMCQELGITYQDGDTWNPYYPRFGVLDCYLCTCKDGKRNCKRVPCPEVRACTADDPYEDVTICCPKCSRIPNNPELPENTTYQPPVLWPDPPTPMPCKDNCSHNLYEPADGYGEQIAIEFIIARHIDIYVWSSDISMMQYESYTSKYFNDNFINKRFRYIGCVTQNLVTKLRKKFNTKNRMKNLTYCQEHCAEQVIKVLQPQEDSKSCK